MKSVKPKKHLGQHFLTDLGIARRIADTVDACPGIPVLEIGPGMGVLTQYLVEKPREVKAVEIDKESVAYLYDRFPKLRDNIIGDDFLRMDLTTLFDGRPFVLTGNYPYDISSQIFFKMLDNKELIPCCTGMIQREVALRMAAAPGSKAYGILSVRIPKVEQIHKLKGYENIYTASINPVFVADNYLIPLHIRAFAAHVDGKYRNLLIIGPASETDIFDQAGLDIILSKPKDEKK